jgi:hypothetical protein
MSARLQWFNIFIIQIQNMFIVSIFNRSNRTKNFWQKLPSRYQINTKVYADFKTVEKIAKNCVKNDNNKKVKEICIFLILIMIIKRLGYSFFGVSFFYFFTVDFEISIKFCIFLYPSWWFLKYFCKIAIALLPTFYQLMRFKTMKVASEKCVLDL